MGMGKVRSVRWMNPTVAPAENHHGAPMQGGADTGCSIGRSRLCIIMFVFISHLTYILVIFLGLFSLRKEGRLPCFSVPLYQMCDLIHSKAHLRCVFTEQCGKYASAYVYFDSSRCAQDNLQILPAFIVVPLALYYGGRPKCPVWTRSSMDGADAPRSPSSKHPQG
ncbi:hypothetical protein BJ912DRAFT_356801 [Pholiota molesta]|nr:hypothetical protein BJ912DRAFT_356801 [Pholiota molesta]